jgi:hypothetical protein
MRLFLLFFLLLTWYFHITFLLKTALPPWSLGKMNVFEKKNNAGDLSKESRVCYLLLLYLSNKTTYLFNTYLPKWVEILSVRLFLNLNAPPFSRDLSSNLIICNLNLYWKSRKKMVHESSKSAPKKDFSSLYDRSFSI